MSDDSVEDRIQCIQALHIASLQAHAVPVGDGEGSAAVGGGSFISFLGDLPAQQKEDVLHSTLFAQLVANKQHDRQNDSEAWYDRYKDVLASLGWMIRSFDMAELSDADTYVSVDKLLLKLAADHLSAEELALFQKVVESLGEGQTRNEVATKLFNSQSMASKKANFQVGVASSDTEGNTKFKISIYFYSADQDIDNVLFYENGSQKTLEFRAGHETMVLNNDLYSQVREVVSSKLGQHAEDLVENIQIGPSVRVRAYASARFPRRVINIK
ncbi:hypothetical protein K466DRAFT_664221 [Polyporus arcularius HHB13444]|uniref:Uncharacterized protein n=1 Tax=Polyporus arcularius HHB13444 TaxID=1314778 RepID=A0A5C3P826_9APHY|nr:hypothetical protein K466DRAFT_664221 [Polyporus arcularius HHB13444]